MKRVSYSFTITLILISQLALGQSVKTIPCAADQAMEKFFLTSPEKKSDYLRELSSFNELAKLQAGTKAKTTFIVPTVVHVIHFNGNGNISDAQVLDGINQINEDFKRENADTTDTRAFFKPYAGSLDIEFRLAKKDPNGNCTNGIVRVNDSKTNNFGGQDALISSWDNTKYFNIWIVNDIENFTGGGGVILGYAYYPSNGNNPLYGLVNRNDAWGRIGNIIYQGRTPTHEVGHALNLAHTFNGSCGSDCSSSGDFVCDTPPASSPTQGCNLNLNSCTNDTQGPSPFTTDVKNQIENYMSYDDCQNMFSQGQVARMTSALTSINNLVNLTSTQNLINTGTDDAYFFTAPNCAPVAQFSVDKKINCVNGSFQFEDFSFNAIKDSTWSYNWSFPGGSPASSSLEKPVVTYNQAGQYDVSLTVSNINGSSAVLTKSNYIDILNGSGNFIAPRKVFFTEAGFPVYQNDQSLSWDINNKNNSAFTWERNTNAFFSAPASLQIRNFNNSGNGEKNSLISPVADLTQVSNAYLNFWIAYAQRNSEVELLNISYSNDCGATWNLLKSELSIYLYSRSKISSSEFVPLNSNEWAPYSLNISNLAGQDNLKFQLEFKSLGGNNIYIDDFEISQSPLTQISNSIENQYFKIFPNPSSGFFTIEPGNFFGDKGTQFVVINNLGKIVAGFTIDPNQTGINIDLSHLPAGMYLLKPLTNKRINTKLIIE
ncbi:T9SS type A sorting domain-containing protein [Hyphobacterium sp. CCMP332]|nr:T9SS type A sorting domain-containing protein [Hyphobacterium sp. CCMP332]